MPIILDLDNTLLDTSKIKKELAMALIKDGVSEELFKKVYKKIRQKGFYNHKIYLDYLSKEKDLDIKKCKKTLEKTDDKIKNYLYPDALGFLKKMKKTGVKMILLSYGDPEFQKIKIKETKISQFFDKIIITETKKTPKVKKLVKNARGEVFFINDDTEEIKEIAKQIKKVKIIHVKREERDKDIENINLPKIPVFSNLKEVEYYLRKLN